MQTSPNAPSTSDRRTSRTATALAALIAVLATVPATRAAPPAAAAATAAVVTTLERPWQELLTDAELDAAAASLKPRADEAVAALVAAFGRGDQTFAYRHRAVQVLERLGTPAARAALLDVALGRSAERLPSMTAWAARAYLATPAGKADPRPLLAADDPDVLNAALQALAGTALDRPLFDQVLALLRREDGGGGGGAARSQAQSWVVVRHAAADVLAGDATEALAAEKVAAIVAAIARVPQATPAAGKAVSLSHWTAAEASYHQYLTALARLKGADAVLREATDKAQGVPRDVLLLARAQRGDPAARDGVRAILNDTEAGMRRAWAARSLAAVGTNDDLPALRRLAGADPLERESGSDVGPPGDRAHVFPVRDAARDAAREIEKRAKAEKPPGT